MRQGEYKPRVIRGRVKVPFTAWEEYRERYKGQGFTVNDFKAMQKADQYFNGVELYLSSWAYDHHGCWHLWNWETAVDERVKLGMYHAEQYKGGSPYKNNFKQFAEDWEKKTYDPVMVYTFPLDHVEVLEVLQEEVDTIDHEKTRRTAERQKGQLQAQKRQGTKKKYRPKPKHRR